VRADPGARAHPHGGDGYDVGRDQQSDPRLRDHLLAEKVTCVVIEATSDYWKPFYYLLEDELDMMLVNARAVKNMPGRKSDVSDAAWLADLGAHGLVRASLVPPPPIRQLRDLTRARTVITRERSREAQRLEKLLESSRAMLEALIDGEQDPAAIAELVHWRMRPKIPALTGRFGEHHRFMTRLFLDRIDGHNADIARLDARIEAAMEPFRGTRELLMSIPGISRIVAEVFIAETGADMSVFPAAQHLASWCGVCPGSNESAGKAKSTSTRPGDRYLRGALGIAALSVVKRKQTYFWAKYQRITARRGPMRALVSVEHAMVVAAWHMLTNGEFYREPGLDYYTRRVPAKTKTRAIRQLESLGYKVTLEPLADTA
jgi:transposase